MSHCIVIFDLSDFLKLRYSFCHSFDPAITDIEQLVPRAGEESVEWLTSFNHGVDTIFDSSADEDDDDDYDEEEDVFGLSFL